MSAQASKPEIKKLLVRAPNWIGDAVMATPTLSALRERFREAEITLLAKPAVAALFEHHPDVDRVLIYRDPGAHSGVPGFFRLVRSLRRERFDSAFLFQNAFEAALLTALAGIPERAGYAADGRRFLLTRSLPKPDGPIHQRDAYLSLMNLWGGALQARKPYLMVTADEKRRARERLESHGISGSDLLVGINPGAAYGSAKRWLPARFAAVADRLAERHGAKVLIFGGPAEAAVAEEVAGGMKRPRVILAGKTGVREAMALISECRLFITNDSGPMHIASAFGVPLVAVFGPTNPAATSPAGLRDRIVQNKVECAPCTHPDCPIDHRCMEGISVEAVLNEAEKQLSRENAAPVSPAQTGGGESQPARSAMTGPHGKRGAVFLDRDGTINVDVGHMNSLEKFALIPGAAPAIAQLNRRGIPVFIITNQSGVARGIFTEGFVGEVHRHLQALLAEEGGSFDAAYYCPHHPDFMPCGCRKPAMGMIEKAVREHSIDLSRSYIVGDKPIDMALAQGGAKGILVQTGYGKKSLIEMAQSGIRPDHVADDLARAVEWILGDMKERKMIDA